MNPVLIPPSPAFSLKSIWMLSSYLCLCLLSISDLSLYALMQYVGKIQQSLLALGTWCMYSNFRALRGRVLYKAAREFLVSLTTIHSPLLVQWSMLQWGCSVMLLIRCSSFTCCSQNIAIGLSLYHHSIGKLVVLLHSWIIQGGSFERGNQIILTRINHAEN